VFIIDNQMFIKGSYEESITYLKRTIGPAFETDEGRLRSRPPKPVKSSISKKAENKEQPLSSDSEEIDESAVLSIAGLSTCPFTLNLGKSNEFLKCFYLYIFDFHSSIIGVTNSKRDQAKQGSGGD
jgi:hypothetical protein